jgi:hypothetical protein
MGRAVMRLMVGSLGESMVAAARCGRDVQLGCVGVLEHALRLLDRPALLVRSKFRFPSHLHTALLGVHPTHRRTRYLRLRRYLEYGSSAVCAELRRGRGAEKIPCRIHYKTAIGMSAVTATLEVVYHGLLPVGPARSRRR